MSKQILQFQDFLYVEQETGIKIVGYLGSENPLTIPETINGIPVTALGYCGEGNTDGITVKLNKSISCIDLDAIAFKNADICGEDKNCWITDVETSDDQPYFFAEKGMLYSKDKSTLIMCFNRESEKATIPQFVKTIGEYAFYACDEIEEVKLPNSISYVGDYAFSSNVTLKVSGKETELGNNVAGEIEIGASNKYVLIGGCLLTADKTRLLKKVEASDTFEVPEGVEIIDDEALGNFSVSNISLNNGLKKIGHNVFSRANVKEIDIPSSVEYMESDAFSGYNTNIHINLLPGNQHYRLDGAVIYRIEDDGSETVFRVQNKAITQIELSSKVKILSAGAFSGCSRLKKLILNEGLECFDEECLSGPLNNEAQLDRILIPSTVKEIKLAGANGVLGGKIKYTIHESNPYYFMDDDICYAVDEQGKYTVIFCQDKMIRHAVINEGTIAIAPHAFSIPESHSYYGNDDSENVFVRLQKVDLPDSLESIGVNAFAKCASLTEIVIGPAVNSIHASAFEGCKKLKKMVVSSDNAYYTVIDDVLFDKSVQTLVIYPEGKKIDQYELPATVETFGAAFASVKGIKSLHLSANITKLSRNAFPNTCEIKALYIKNDIQNIDPCAFGEEAYESSTRDKPIEVFVNSNYYFAKYVEESMKSPKGDILVSSESDTPEMRKIKKLFAFKKVNDGLCITEFLEPSHGKKSSSTVTIPGSFGDQPVVELGESMFGRLSYGIETIIVSEGIKRIGQSVFYGHSNLKKIVLPSSVEEISPWVFTDDEKEFKDLYLHGEDLVIVVQPDSYAEKFITTYKYEDGTRPRIVINDGGADYLRMVREGKGYKAVLQEGLEPTDRVIVPNTYRNMPVTKIVLFEKDESYGFDYGEISPEICALSVPENVKEIVELSKFRPRMKTDDGLPSISVADGNKYYWSDGVALYSKDQKTLIQLIDYTIEEYSVHNNTEIIADNAFANCGNIKKVILPESIRVLGERAFASCGHLEEIVGMEYVQEIGKSAISYTPFEQNLEYVVVGKTLTKYSGSKASFTVPEGVEIIGESAFSIYTYGKNVDALQEVVLPSSVKKLSQNAFNGRNALRCINLPEGLTSIDANAFNGCDALESIHIPASVEDLSPYAFSVRDWDREKSRMTSITVDEGNQKYCAINNVLYTKDMTEILLIPTKADIEELLIPETVKKISGTSYCSNIKKIVFSGSVDEWNGAFSNCAALTEVVFEGEGEKIADYAFANSKKLKKIAFGSALREIGSRAFEKTGLKELSLPETVEHIGEEAFAGLKIQKVTLPKSMKTLGWGAFSCIPEIEVYDTIDPEAKDASRGIDTTNGYPNSMVGYVGMGPANAMWQCAANHKWVNYTIVVRSAETEEIKYKVWMGAESSQRQYYCFLSSAWGHNATFAFAQLDEFFPKIRGAEHKLQVAQYRLEYPYELSDEAKAKYETYVKRNSKKGE